MRTILTAGALCAALLIAAVSTVQAKSPLHPQSDTTTPIVVAGE